MSTSLFFVCIAACHGVISRSVSMTGGTGPKRKKYRGGENANFLGLVWPSSVTDEAGHQGGGEGREIGR